MTSLGSLQSALVPPWRHASVEEYTAFLQKCQIDGRHRKELLHFREQFVQCYPDLRDWFKAPLPERVGRLQGENAFQVKYQVSYQARRYLMFLGVQGYAQFDWEWLIALRQVRLGTLLASMDLDVGLDTLVEEAIGLGYQRHNVTLVLRWVVSRILLHTSHRHVNHIRETHLDALSEALSLFRERPDVVLFYGSVEQCRKETDKLQHTIKTLRVVLYHRGQISTEPRIIRPSVTYPVIKPRMEAVVTRYLSARRLTDRSTTVRKSEGTLHQFIAWLSQAHPHLESFAEVTRDHMLEYVEALASMTSARTKRPLATTTQRRVLSCLSVFFQDVARWQWDDVPDRPLLQAGDFPKRPLRIPKYIPDDELSRLMTAIRALECPYQRAALLIARWSGARRGEIRRLSVDCLDKYPDGTPRLRIPVGKTKRERMIPLNEEAAAAIRALQQYRRGERGFSDEQTGVVTRYLFVRRGKLISAKYLFQFALRTACKAAGLVTTGDKATVTAHRFRHTVGTQLTERGARLRTVMIVLGHESADMSVIYAQISDKEVLKDYQGVLGPGATIAGPSAEALRSGELGAEAVDWLKSNFLKTELELGRCLRLPQEGPCECELYLTCAKFVTTPAYAPRLRRRRRIEQEFVEDALARGWQREVERHQCTIRRLEQLLIDLGEPIEGPEATD